MIWLYRLNVVLSRVCLCISQKVIAAKARAIVAVMMASPDSAPQVLLAQLAWNSVCPLAGPQHPTV